jgi:hypothetical protein
MENSRIGARRCCSRGIICERVRAPADQAIWRRGPGHSRARRRRHPSSTTSPSELLDNGVLRSASA